MRAGEYGRTIYTEAEFAQEGERRFGPKGRDWRFVCPNCKTVQTWREFVELGGMTPEECESMVGFSCIGRLVKGRGCDWSLGGLLKIHTVEIEFHDGHKRPVFEFDEAAPLIVPCCDWDRDKDGNCGRHPKGRR